MITKIFRIIISLLIILPTWPFCVISIPVTSIGIFIFIGKFDKGDWESIKYILTMPYQIIKHIWKQGN